ncbi:MAG: Ku protein [Candidatus Rokubacteria bacterium]|nr:Ku protein [Candidatus Rokubacteria bacterium]
MPLHAVSPGTISFGLVAIPVRLYTATSSQQVAFNMLHAKCGSRIRQQTYCPRCEATIERAELTRGYEFAKDQYVRISDDELRSVEGEASRVIDIAEFVPLPRVDPIYFEKTYYLGPEKGGEKPYRLLADAMAKSEKVALAKFIMRGKETLVLIRAAQGGLMLHTMYFADEVRNFGEVDKGAGAQVRPNELELAVKLIEGLSNEAFEPDQYADEYRQRVLDMIGKKVEGEDIETGAAPAPRPQVIDLMDALKASLEKKPLARAARGAAAARAASGKREAAAAKREAAPPKRAQAGGRK